MHSIEGMIFLVLKRIFKLYPPLIKPQKIAAIFFLSPLYFLIVETKR